MAPVEDWSTCLKCGDEFPIERKRLGYDTCLRCGERDAQIEKDRKAKCSAPAYNKGAYQYVANLEQAKTLGKK